MLKKLLTKNSLLILIGGVVLAVILILPSRLAAPCPLGLTFEPALQKGCPLFVDQDFDGICDLIQGTTVSYQPTGFEFTFLKEFAIFVLLLAGGIFLNWKKTQYYSALRLALLALSLLYFGLLLRQALCPIATLQMVFVSKERVVLTFFIFLVFLLPILTTLVFGRIFCHFMCPIGAVQELIFRISRKFGKIPTLARLPIFLFYLPYLILFLVAFGSAYFSITIFCKFDPFGALFGCNPADWKLPFLVALLTTSLFIFRPFCEFFCPLGAIFKFLEKFRILRPKR